MARGCVLCALLTFAGLGCAPAPVEVAPPGQPEATVAADLDDVAVRVSFERSSDDGDGSGLATKYIALRETDASGRFLPFHSREANEVERGDADERTGMILDVSAQPGRSYRYRVHVLGEKERSTYAGPGVVSGVSSPSEPVTAEGEAVAAGAIAAPPIPELTVPDASDGRSLNLAYLPSDSDDAAGTVAGYFLLRREGDEAVPFPHSVLPATAGEGDGEKIEKPIGVPQDGGYEFEFWAVPAIGDAVGAGGAVGRAEVSEATEPAASVFNSQKSNVLIVLLLTVVLTFGFLWRALQGHDIFIRRIPGVDAIEEAVGRATEMGRPILYVPGIDEIQNIQTIASILILGRVAEMVARYDSEIRVPCCIPLVATVSEEVVRQGFYDAGRPDAHRPQNIQWISSEQFAFCAGANGIMLREKPATNLYLGRFFAESLILAETGYVNRAIQIAGTAAISQLPFFIAACDYTIIGEELFAVSAYMSREPRLLSNLKAADWIKALCVIVLFVGALLAVFSPGSGATETLIQFLKPGS